MLGVERRKKDLQEKVNKREALIATILHFVESVVLQHGTTTKRGDSDNGDGEVILKDFGGFDILWHKGKRCNWVHIFHHPAGQISRLVFMMNDWHTGIDGCRVMPVSEDIKWEKLFSFAMENSDQILAKRQGALIANNGHSSKVEEEDHEVLLVKKARRLGVI